MKYSYIWFDLGLTLVHTSRVSKYKEILKNFNIDKKEEDINFAFHMADKTFMREYPGVLGKSGVYFMPWYYGVLNYYLHIEVNLVELMGYMKSFARENDFKWKVFDYTKDTLLKLKDIGLKVGLISNWDSSCREVLKDTGLDEILDTVIISQEIGVEKPSADIFEIAFAKARVSAEESLYIGDNYYDDVLGAQKVGLKCLLINPYEKYGIEEIQYPHIVKDIREIFKYVG